MARSVLASTLPVVLVCTALLWSSVSAGGITTWAVIVEPSPWPPDEPSEGIWGTADGTRVTFGGKLGYACSGPSDPHSFVGGAEMSSAHADVTVDVDTEGYLYFWIRGTSSVYHDSLAYVASFLWASAEAGVRVRSFYDGGQYRSAGEVIGQDVSDQPYQTSVSTARVSQPYRITAETSFTVRASLQVDGSGYTDATHSGANGASVEMIGGMLFSPTLLSDPEHQVPIPEPGDVNLDGAVDFTDYQILETNFGVTTGATWAMGDFDGDGAVTFTDYQTLESNFGSGTPEPATLAFLALGGLALARRRR